MFDQKLLLLIHSLVGKSRLLDFFGIFLADYFGYLLIIAALIIIWRLENWKKRAHYLLIWRVSRTLER